MSALLVVILFIKKLTLFLALLVVKKPLEIVGKNGFPHLSNVLGVEAFKCHISRSFYADKIRK